MDFHYFHYFIFVLYKSDLPFILEDFLYFFLKTIVVFNNWLKFDSFNVKVEGVNSC